MKLPRNLRRILAAGVFLLAVGGAAWGMLYAYSSRYLPAEEKPEPAPAKKYDYYLIYDEDSLELLMYVPVVVNVDDELITEGNKRYIVVKVAENRAYARYVEEIKLPPAPSDRR